MTIEEKLKAFREKITNAAVFDNNLRQLLGIELFDFIQTNNTLKNEFDGRLNYLKNLADDRNFKLLQDNLFETIQKILKLTSLKEIRQPREAWHRALFNRLKTRLLVKGKEKDFLTLPELYTALQDKNNYYRLGDRAYSVPAEEISVVTRTVSVKKQYEMVEEFFKQIFLNKFIDDKEGRARFDELISEYNECWYKLDELIYRIPIQLHSQNFERFFFDCVEFHPRLGYEFWYNPSLNSNSDRNAEKPFKKTKENALIVIDDLIEVSTNKKFLPIAEKQEPEIKRMVDNEFLQQTKEPLHIVIDEVKKDIGIRGFEEKVVLQKPKNKKIQLRKFPTGLKWEETSIQFLNEHEVIVKAKNETLQTTYEAMGFQDEKKKLPNKQWQFLRLLALKNGGVSWENNSNLPLKQINSIKKQKQLLSEALKAYFQIYDSEPFHDYKTEKAYRIKITLTPEPELKDIDEREVYDE